MKKNTLIIVVLALSILTNIVSLSYIRNIKSTSGQLTEAEEEQVFEADTLSDWDIFTLALMKVESEYDNNAVSSVGARGYFQMTPIYVREVNRVHHTDFTFSQVTDFETAYEIFDLMQQAHNPEYNMVRALELHNGKHKWYNKRVFNAMNQIKLYEEMRSKIKSI